MLKRLYIHNYKCLVNFEINFDENISLFLGGNGSGKTSAFTALYELQQFIINNDKLDEYNKSFQSNSLTRGRNNLVQRFELDVEGYKGLYHYVIDIDHDPIRNLRRVVHESLSFNKRLLFQFYIDNEEGIPIGTGQLFSDLEENSQGVSYPSDWLRSGLGGVQERHYNKTLIWFKNWLTQLFIVHINPSIIKIDMLREEFHPQLDLSNYVAWLNYLNDENREGIAHVENELKEIIKGFTSFKFSQYGTKKILEFKIDKQLYTFDELSDGQKILATLYTLIYCTPDGSIICIDEPENFLALPEIQPWFDELYNQCEERDLQVLLISHHPKIINFLANDSGYWFSRENNLTRIQKITPENESGLSIAQLIERGWIYEY